MMTYEYVRAQVLEVMPWACWLLTLAYLASGVWGSVNLGTLEYDRHPASHLPAEAFAGIEKQEQGRLF